MVAAAQNVDPLELLKLLIREPGGVQYLVGGAALVHNPPPLRFLFQNRAVQYLQKPQLQHVGVGTVHRVKGTGEGLVPLQRKACDKIHVQVRVPRFAQKCGPLQQPLHIAATADGTQSLRIGGLHPRLKLKQPFPGASDESEGGICQKLRFYFKMEVGHPVVMGDEMREDGVRVGRAAVEGAVHQLYLGDASFQENIQVAAGQRRGHKPHAAAPGGKAVGTAERTSPRGFKV